MSPTSVKRKKQGKKPPACDACKARRVLCHPQTNGAPCPRCAEKGVICRTTPVARGRPRKKPIAAQPISAVPDELRPVASGSKTPPYESILAAQPYPELSVASLNSTPDLPDLSPELVKHLFECFAQLPQYRLPLFRTVLKNALSSMSWQIHFLPPEMRVLALCVMALSSMISFDEAILGPGPRPTSFTDHTVFCPGADLRAYGVRRAPMCRALHAQAFAAACDARIHLQSSEVNAGSCFILDVLEGRDETSSRPWAVAYVSHIRTLAASWEEQTANRAVWAGFLMAEALTATAQRKPVIVTHNDQLLITGSEPPSLEHLLESVQATVNGSKRPSQHTQHTVYVVIQPFLFHITRLSRELSEKITGDYARRHPISETAVINILSALTILHSITSLAFDQVGYINTAKPLFHLPSSLQGDRDLYAATFAISFGFTSLVLALYRETAHRTAKEAHGTQSQFTKERHTLLRRQVHELAGIAAEYVARSLHILPTVPHLTLPRWRSLQGWAQFCLDEADAAGAIPPGRLEVFTTITDALKLNGYSCDLPLSSSLIERMESYMTEQWTSSFGASSESALTNINMFSFDNSWMGMFDRM
ncbi:hypothetical protein B0H10DRAFT_2025620 [Mycena sp. CBHHK59/15]|nr:hypothetical protein B0H10DRAFT_2025620 [Mycena sp. CBHHK59/15]